MHWPTPLQRAADADEPPELNYVRKHALAMKQQGLANPAARLFSNPAGTLLLLLLWVLYCHTH